MSQYRVAEQASWAVEACGVVVVNRATGVTTTLGYPRAAIWDFIARGQSGARIRAMLCAVASCDPPAARALLLETVAALREAGLLTEREPRG